MSITVNSVTWVQVALLIVQAITLLAFVFVLWQQKRATDAARYSADAASVAARAAATEARRNRPVIIARAWGLENIEIKLLNAGASTAFDMRAIGEVSVGASIAIAYEISGRDLVADSNEEFTIPHPDNELGPLIEESPEKLRLFVTALWADVPGEELSIGSYFEFSNILLREGSPPKTIPTNEWRVRRSMVSRPEGDLPDARKRAVFDWRPDV